MLPCVTFFQGKITVDPRHDPQYRRSLAKQTDDTSKVVKRKRHTQPQKRLPVDKQDKSVDHPPALLDPQVELPDHPPALLDPQVELPVCYIAFFLWEFRCMNFVFKSSDLDQPISEDNDIR